MGTQAVTPDLGVLFEQLAAAVGPGQLDAGALDRAVVEVAERTGWSPAARSVLDALAGAATACGDAGRPVPALRDPVTGLPDRALLTDRLERALARLGDAGGYVGVAMLDLDRFKGVNDAFGHATGDRLLRAVAERLSGILGPHDTIARLGGDEFVVVLEGRPSAEAVHGVTERLLATLVRPFAVHGREHHLAASTGLVVVDRPSDAGSVLRDVEVAMGQAKERGRGRLERFDELTRDRLVRRAGLAHDLRASLARGELTLEYQPLFRISDDELVGAEALLRWDHPVHGRIPPDEFVPVAEEHGLIVPIGRWVLDTALAELGVWHRLAPGREPLHVTVNVSALQLTDDDLPGVVSDLLARHGITPRRLCLELTESALMARPEAGRATLGRLRALGVGIAIDDFGTGYSSLAYLRGLPVSSLKIDRSFVAGLGHDPRDSRVVASIIALAREFGLSTVAEGVDGIRQLAALRRLGCTLVQGFHLQRPLPAVTMRELAGAHPVLTSRAG